MAGAEQKDAYEDRPILRWMDTVRSHWVPNDGDHIDKILSDFAARMEMECKHHMWEFVMEALQLSTEEFEQKVDDPYEMQRLVNKWKEQDLNTVVPALLAMQIALKVRIEQCWPAAMKRICQEPDPDE